MKSMAAYIFTLSLMSTYLYGMTEQTLNNSLIKSAEIGGSYGFARIKRALKKGADVNFQDFRGKNALHIVLNNQKNAHGKKRAFYYEAIIQLLDKYGIDRDIKDRDGCLAGEKPQTKYSSIGMHTLCYPVLDNWLFDK